MEGVVAAAIAVAIAAAIAVAAVHARTLYEQSARERAARFPTTGKWYSCSLVGKIGVGGDDEEQGDKEER